MIFKYLNIIEVYVLSVSSHYRRPVETLGQLGRGTQRIVSVEYLFGRTVIASNVRLGKCHLELS